MALNQVLLCGRLGQDPESRSLPDGKVVTNFSIATTERFGDKEKTEWHSIVVWGRRAESCAKHLFKGRQVFIRGRLQTRSWDNKEGRKVYKTEIVADDVEFIGPGRQQDQPGQYGHAQHPSQPVPSTQPQYAPPPAGYTPPAQVPPPPQAAFPNDDSGPLSEDEIPF